MSGMLRLYRIVSNKKISSARLLLYLLLAYAAAGILKEWQICLLNTLIILGGLLLASLLNDYYDAKLLGEDNEVGSQMKSGKISPRNALLLAWAPWLGALFAYLILAFQSKVSLYSLILLWVSFALCVAYSAPPLRLKTRRGWGILTPPVGIYLLFMESFLLVRGFPCTDTPAPWFLASEIFVFACYLEFLHISDDSLKEREVHRMSGAKALLAAQLVAAAGFAVSLSSIVFLPIAVIPATAWLLRLFSLLGISPEAIASRRKSIFSNVYQVWEFALWGIVFLEKGFCLGIMPLVYSTCGIPI